MSEPRMVCGRAAGANGGNAGSDEGRCGPKLLRRVVHTVVSRKVNEVIYIYIEIPAMAAEAGRETRQGAESDKESDGCDGTQDCERVRVRSNILSRKAL